MNDKFLDRVAPATAVERSHNEKIGDVSATYVSQSSCPPDCKFLGLNADGTSKGCYAQTGFAGITTARLNLSDERGAENLARWEARAIDTLSGKRPLRLHVVGDARTNKAASVLGKAARRYEQRGVMPRHGKKTWTYTHAWKKVARASWGESVSVLASCETTAEAKRAMAEGYAAALVVSEFKQEGAYQQDGVTVLPCPAQTRTDCRIAGHGTFPDPKSANEYAKANGIAASKVEHVVTCASCNLCRDDARLREADMVIAFAVHGSAKKAVARTLASLDVL